MLGILPAAGAGSRIQPLAFSKEVLPVASRLDGDGVERPIATSEFLVERMVRAGAERICFVISPDKTDIVEYYGRHDQASRVFYVTQERPGGLCDALFRAVPHVRADEDVLVGLPDTVWFPVDGLARLPTGVLAFLLFAVAAPERFDAVVAGADGNVSEIQVKSPRPSTEWVWGAFRMPGRTFLDLHRLWLEPGRGDEYVGTLVNEHLRRGGRALGCAMGERYYDIGTIEGYREAVAQLSGARADPAQAPVR